jgi:hypothetical protein
MKANGIGVVAGWMIVCVGVLGAGVAAAAPQAGGGTAKPQQKVALSAYVKATAERTLADAQAGNGIGAAVGQLTTLFDQAIAWSKDNDLEPIERATLALRLAQDVQQLPFNEQADWLAFFKANPDLTATLIFLIKPEQNPAKVFAVLKKLRDARGSMLEKYANLTAAICVDHAEVLKRGYENDISTAPDPLSIFDFYGNKEPRMLFGIRGVPAELLVWVVDTTASIDDMNWALAKYAGDRAVGARFFDVKYDYDNFEKGTPKKVSLAGYNLPNLLRYGGICADQAYFAMEVAKSIGVPSAYAVGDSANSPHAWVGFLQAKGRTAHWNFNVGRYPEYRGVRGEVMDPQTRQDIPDSYVSVLAEMIGTRPIDRLTGCALVDAARRLIALQEAGQELQPGEMPTDPAIANARPTRRQATTADALALAELALQQSAGYPPAWFVVRDLAAANKLSTQDKQRWAQVLLRLGAAKYPDFTLAILSPMIKTVSNPQEQNAMWNAAFNLFQTRFDLAASIRMEQAALWQAQGDTLKAGTCYMDVIQRYADAGPFVLDALGHAEKLLTGSDQQAKVLLLYQACWAKTVPPPPNYSQILGDSNWYKVGKLYADKLRAAGQPAAADAVLDKLKHPWK